MMVGATVINGLIHAQAKASPPREAAALLKAVLLINRLIMAPSLLLIPLSGIGLMHFAGYSLVENWLLWSAILSICLIIAYVLGLRLETHLHTIAEQADKNSQPALPDAYARMFLKAAPIGLGALIMSLISLALMVFKPF